MAIRPLPDNLRIIEAKCFFVCHCCLVCENENTSPRLINLIGTLVLPGTDLRLYEWEEGSRGLSERGSRRGGAVAAQVVEGRGRRRYSTVATVQWYCSRKEGERRRLGFLPAPFRKPETIICFCLISCESLTSYLYPFT